jgi:transposase
VSVLLTPGQRHDAAVFPLVLADVPAACPVEFVVADKAYDSDDIRETLVDRDIAPVIPSTANRAEPIEYDTEMYRQRNQVERLIGKLKQFRRVATRYEKLARTFLAIFHLTAAFVMIR